MALFVSIPISAKTLSAACLSAVREGRAPARPRQDGQDGRDKRVPPVLSVALRLCASVLILRWQRRFHRNRPTKAFILPLNILTCIRSFLYGLKCGIIRGQQSLERSGDERKEEMWLSL